MQGVHPPKAKPMMYFPLLEIFPSFLNSSQCWKIFPTFPKNIYVSSTKISDDFFISYFPPTLVKFPLISLNLRVFCVLIGGDLAPSLWGDGQKFRRPRFLNEVLLGKKFHFDGQNF